MVQLIVLCGGIRRNEAFRLRVSNYFLGRFHYYGKFGKEAVRDTYNRAKAEWKNDRIYGTELSIVLNHKCHYWYEERNTKLSRLYAELWEEWHGWVLENWEGEDLGYYLRIMD